jgi:hypothetical protein
MIPLAETFPTNAAGIVVGIVGIAMVAAWLAYLYR